MIRAALGVLGWQPSDFWEATPCETFLALEGNRERRQTEYEDAWERARLMAYYTAAPHLKSKSGIRQFMPLPWDNRETKDRPKLTPEEVEATLKKFEKTFPGWRAR